MCRQCVAPLVGLAEDYWQQADETMATAIKMKDKGAIKEAVEMQHSGTMYQALGFVFQALANIMASITRDDPGEDHPKFNVPSQN